MWIHLVLNSSHQQKNTGGFDAWSWLTEFGKQEKRFALYTEKENIADL